MARQQRWTAVVSTGLMVGALLACKKKPDAAAEASATASAPAAPATTAAPAATSAAPTPTAEAPAATEAKLGDVKRYGVEKESKLDDAGVRVTADELKVYNEADTKTDDVATLPKGLLVFRQVKMDAFTLVEFPSGVGQFSQGWVETKSLSETPEKVTRSVALSEKKTATVKVTDGGAPATDGGKADDKKTDAGADKKTDAGADKKTDTKTDTKKTDTKTDTKKTDTKTDTKKTDTKSSKVTETKKSK
jgi:hypothetical protein